MDNGIGMNQDTIIDLLTYAMVYCYIPLHCK